MEAQSDATGTYDTCHQSMCRVNMRRSQAWGPTGVKNADGEWRSTATGRNHQLKKTREFSDVTCPMDLSERRSSPQEYLFFSRSRWGGWNCLVHLCRRRGGVNKEGIDQSGTRPNREHTETGKIQTKNDRVRE